MPPGFLAVFSEPGANVTIDEYQDWYNNEHIPIRLNHLPSFLTGARYSASDSLRPSWVAVYDVDDTSTFQHESYTRLRASRSPREADVVKRLELLDRRTYETIGDENKGLSSSYHPRDPTKFILTQGIECPGDDVLKGWLDAMAKDLHEVEGWTRTRIYKCIDNLKSGVGVESSKEEQKVPKYLVVHGELVGVLAVS
jgi:5'-3' exonuclease